MSFIVFILKKPNRVWIFKQKNLKRTFTGLSLAFNKNINNNKNLSKAQYHATKLKKLYTLLDKGKDICTNLSLIIIRNFKKFIESHKIFGVFSV